MKYTSIIVASIFLSGCYQTVNLYDIDRAIVVCGSKENIVQITAWFIGDEAVMCRDSKTHNLDGISAQKQLTVG